MRELISSDILRKRAEEKIEQIYRNLKRNHSKILDMSLYSGKMGICLFFFYYEIFTGKKGNAKKILLEINDKITKRRIALIVFCGFLNLVGCSNILKELDLLMLI